MDRGELVGDDVMIAIVTERLQRPDALGGFVLDGFPRTVAQAAALDAMMSGRDAIIIVDIVVPDAELVRRLASRMICDECGADAGGQAQGVGAAADKVVNVAAFGSRAPEAAAAVQAQTEPLRCRRCGGRIVQRTDDNVDIVRERLKVYHRQTAPLVEYYRARPAFRSIDGVQSMERVAEDLAAAIEAAGSGAALGGRR
jgi:adenylate kinase